MMAVEITRIGGLPIGFEAFAEKHALTLEVKERVVDGKFVKADARYYAHFKDSDIKEGSCLRGGAGNGTTPEEAIGDYARGLLGQLLVIDAFEETRREIQCPTEWEKEI